MPTSNLETAVKQRFDAFINADINSVPYLIMTIFGDSVMPHGGNIWLGSLVQLLAPLGVSERLVRTSVFRLKKDGWLDSIKVGRKSFYQALNADEILKNDRQLYYQKEEWDGNWRMVIGGSMEKSSAAKDQLRKALQKFGFMAVAPNVFTHPTFSVDRINALLTEHQQQDAYVVLLARDTDNQPLNFAEVKNVLYRGISEILQTRYDEFLQQYQAIAAHKSQLKELSPEHSFLLKTLLIDDYRRLQWRDVIRSTMLMPQNWAGTQARQLTAEVYDLTDKKGQQHFRQLGRCTDGELPAFDEAFADRFSHLL